MNNNNNDNNNNVNNNSVNNNEKNVEKKSNIIIENIINESNGKVEIVQPSLGNKFYDSDVIKQQQY